MKYLLIICALFSACTSLKKTVNQQMQEVTKSGHYLKDSLGRLTVETTATNLITGWVNTSIDSGYDKVTEEEVKEVIDSGVIRRETKRTIKEKGQKRTERLSSMTMQDSASSMITEHSQLREMQEEDSTATVVSVQKEVKRTSFLPWWIWLVAAGIVAILWWKRNPIIDFFT